MKKSSLLVMILLTWSLATHAQNVKTYENKAFKIDYPADWEVTWDSETFVNLASADEVITFDESVILLPKLPQVESLFLSMMPYAESNVTPTDELMNLKLREGVLALLSADDRFYPTLFDFAESWKIDILDFLNSNYMYEFTLAELANYTGRSLATFKRDFAKVSSLSPEKWLLNRRLEAAYDVLSKGNIGVTDAAYKVGFKNRSHFTKSFKDHFGKSPSEIGREMGIKKL